MKDIYGEKELPPALSIDKMEAGMERIRNLVGQYICTNCCSHKVVRTLNTAPGCVDVLEITLHSQTEEVVVPPTNTKDLWFKVHTFICTCKRKALICEIDRSFEFTMSKD